MSGNNRRGRGDGGYRKRGDSWELKFEATDPKTGHRKTRWVTFKGTETAARAKLRELVRQADTGGFIATSRQTFGEVLDAWETGLTVSPKTEERWRELIALHIRPALGPLPLRRIGWERVKTFYRDLAEGTKGRALSRSTIKCIHFIVGQVFSLAEREGLISTNPAKLVKLPKSEKQEIQILDKAQVVTVLEKLRGRNPLYRIAALGLATGMRRGEMLALRWKNVDLDRAVIRVEYSLEQTRAKEKGKPPVLRFKPPKTKNFAALRTRSA